MRIGNARIALVLLGALAACGREPRSEPRAPVAPPAPTIPTEPALAALAHRATAPLTPSSPVYHAAVGGQDRLDQWVSLPGGHCFQIVAAATGAPTPEIELRLMDTNGVQVQSVAGTSGTALLGDRHALCLPSAERYRIVASAATGRGELAVQVWQSQ